jgi:pimeloyl-ACP methyl ester carboxylesterase
MVMLVLFSKPVLCQNVDSLTLKNLLENIPGVVQHSNFHGFHELDFTFNGRKAIVVAPEKAAKGHPWVWRARFWGYEPQADSTLLARGFHVVYCDVVELFGNEEALTLWDDFYKMLVKCKLSKKAVMEGVSRGGVYVYRWAARWPRRVAAVYVYVPVLDMKSWPGGKGKGKCSSSDWELFKQDFNLTTEEEAIAFKGNPLDLTEIIARGKYPMLHVVGDADVVVPVDENTTPFAEKIKAAGGKIEVINIPGAHHSHSLKDPAPIVNFILKAYRK